MQIRIQNPIKMIKFGIGHLQKYIKVGGIRQFYAWALLSGQICNEGTEQL